MGALLTNSAGIMAEGMFALAILGWVAVLVVSIVLQFADWPILDPLLSVDFTLFILFNVIHNLWSTGKLFLQAVPNRTLHDRIRSALLALEGYGLAHTTIEIELNQEPCRDQPAMQDPLEEKILCRF